jgi:hypothetical protein
VSFQNCEFDSCGVHALWIDSSAVTVRNTLVENSVGRGITLFYTLSGVQITNTIIRGCAASGLAIQSMSYPRIVNNVIWENRYHGITDSGNCQPTIINNIVGRNGRFGIIDSSSSFPLLGYNDMFSNSLRGTGGTNYMPDSLLHPTDIAVDPMFADSAAGDFRLSANSPCKHAGDPSIHNPDGSRSDIGAYGGPGAGGGIGIHPAFRASNYRLVTR